MLRRMIFVIAATAITATTALADRALTGEDAAYIDWAARNCGVKGTEHEQQMVEQANASGREAFLHGYSKQLESKVLTSALDTLARQQSLCADIKDWFGPSGSRISNLIEWQGTPASGAPEKTSATAGTGKKGGRHSK